MIKLICVSLLAVLCGRAAHAQAPDLLSFAQARSPCACRPMPRRA